MIKNLRKYGFISFDGPKKSWQYCLNYDGCLYISVVKSSMYQQLFNPIDDFTPSISQVKEILLTGALETDQTPYDFQ